MTRRSELLPAERQEAIVTVIRAFIGASGFSPTLAELADRLDMHPATVYYHVNALCRAGVLRREARRSRTLTIVEEGAA